MKKINEANNQSIKIRQKIARNAEGLETIEQEMNELTQKLLNQIRTRKPNTNR
jgi:hypothetical protein